MMALVNQPVIQSHIEMAARLQKSGIDYDLSARWERGQERSAEAENMAREIADLDWLLYGDSLGLDFGGDGDSGEFLIDLINILFELRKSEE